MAWSAPKTWTGGTMVDAALLNAQVRDNLLVLSTHAHGGGAGDGNDELAGIDTLQMDDIGAAASAGLLRRAGNNLTWGASGFIVTNVNAATAVGSLRTTDGVAGSASPFGHTH